MISCNQLRAVKNGTSILTLSHIDLMLSTSARNIAESRVKSKTQDWFKSLREECLKVMRQQGLCERFYSFSTN